MTVINPCHARPAEKRVARLTTKSVAECLDAARQKQSNTGKEREKAGRAEFRKGPQAESSAPLSGVENEAPRKQRVPRGEHGGMASVTEAIAQMEVSPEEAPSTAS